MIQEFLEFVRASDFRFYQERDLGLDLYHNGLPGLLLAFLVCALVVVFLLAIFHVIPGRKHIVRLLLGIGAAALLLGLGTTYVHYLQLPGIEEQLIRPTAGPPPSSAGQQAAVVALPLFIGVLTFVCGALGCLYMALFWSAGITGKKKERATTS